MKPLIRIFRPGHDPYNHNPYATFEMSFRSSDFQPWPDDEGVKALSAKLAQDIENRALLAVLKGQLLP